MPKSSHTNQQTQKRSKLSLIQIAKASGKARARRGGSLPLIKDIQSKNNYTLEEAEAYISGFMSLYRSDEEQRQRYVLESAKGRAQKFDDLPSKKIMKSRYTIEERQIYKETFYNKKKEMDAKKGLSIDFSIKDNQDSRNTLINTDIPSDNLRDVTFEEILNTIYSEPSQSALVPEEMNTALLAENQCMNYSEFLYEKTDCFNSLPLFIQSKAISKKEQTSYLEPDAIFGFFNKSDF